MSIYKKIAEARVKLQETKLTKSGFNKFANFKYYELADFLPSLNKINLELGICTKFELDTEGKKAILNIFDFELSEEDMQTIASLNKDTSSFFSHYDPATVEMICGLKR